MNTVAINILCLVAFSGFYNIQCDDSYSRTVYDASGPPEVDFPVEMPDSCKNETICTDPGNFYPQNKVEEILRHMQIIDKISAVEDRGGYPGCDSTDCPSCSESKPVYYIKDKDSKVRVVVQSEKKLQQVVHMKRCQKEGSITESTKNFINPRNPAFKNISCKTKYMKGYQFLVLNENYSTERVSPINGIPVCCSCVIEKK